MQRPHAAPQDDGGPERRLRAQVAANARWSRYMAREDQSAAARSAIFARLERQVDPEGRLEPTERACRVP